MENPIITWLSGSLTSWQPTKEELLRSARHMKEIGRLLFSEKKWDRRIAAGYLYEYVIYERIVSLAKETSLVKAIVRKSRDVQLEHSGPPSRLGQNGFYYSHGDLYLRGNGQDLAEFDLLVLSQEGRVTPIEVIASKLRLEELSQESEYKRAVVSFLFQQAHVDFVLISCLNFGNNPHVKEFLANTSNHVLQTPPIDNIISTW